MTAVAASGLLTASCGTGPVPVGGVDLDARTAEVCSALVAALPGTVDGAERRDVEPPGAPGAAWGDPPIVLRCGVAMPESFDDFATCQVTDGVGWFVPEEQMTGTPVAITMTTIGRDVNVEVALPEEHWPPANAMVDLGEAIEAATDEVDPCV